MALMPSEKPTIADDWYRLSFGALYPIVYAHRTVEAAGPEALFSIEQTGVTSSDVVLDLCCGNGRHMAHLVDHARRVVGLDYSPELLALARKTLGAEAPLVRADMRALPFDGVFDAVLNYFTSFGYFLSEEENLAVVRGVARALKRGGRFFIDYMNRAYVEENFDPHSVRHNGEYEIREERWIDAEGPRINKTMTVLQSGRTVSESGESVRLYERGEFIHLLRRGGLEVEHVFGDYTGADFDASRPRMIAVGRKA